jgi:hypothetical protein
VGSWGSWVHHGLASPISAKRISRGRILPRGSYPGFRAGAHDDLAAATVGAPSPDTGPTPGGGGPCFKFQAKTKSMSSTYGAAPRASAGHASSCALVIGRGWPARRAPWRARLPQAAPHGFIAGFRRSCTYDAHARHEKRARLGPARTLEVSVTNWSYCIFLIPQGSLDEVRPFDSHRDDGPAACP